jgi:AcrR family transcriptional regulator
VAEQSRAPLPPRRSHAERTAETRARVIAAVVESIADVGYQRTTAAEIARRAGVTWGAVQHHFGGKDGILEAVLEDSFDRFAARLADLPLEGTSLEERAHLFVERAWAHFASPHYRSTFEILLNHLPRVEVRGEASLQARTFRAWDRVWTRLFPESSISRRRRVRLAHYTLAVLSGLASTVMLEGPGAELPPEELELLAATLARELAG